METVTEMTGRDTQAAVKELRHLAIRALARMYLPDEQAFAFRRRRHMDGDRLEGVSRRYTSTVLIALAGESSNVRDQVLHGDDPRHVCGRMIKSAGATDDAGEAALTLWAARSLEHPQWREAMDAVRRMDPANRSMPTVELAWTLMALVSDRTVVDWALAREVARRLLDAYHRDTAMFSHFPGGVSAPGLRSHVTCFADFVYPTMALAAYGAAADNAEAHAAAFGAAEQMCSLQGPEGQWWWHFDVRTGKVIECFPVYSVHQDSMAPMALRAVEAACGRKYAEPIARSLQWLLDPPETSENLIDPASEVIWRKVARREPGKLARGIQAAASRIHKNLRAPGLDFLLRPGRIDYESRPYHMGWILYAWRPSAVAAPEAADDADD